MAEPPATCANASGVRTVKARMQMCGIGVPECDAQYAPNACACSRLAAAASLRRLAGEADAECDLGRSNTRASNSGIKILRTQTTAP